MNAPDHGATGLPRPKRRAHLPEVFSVLRHRTFATFWTAGVVSDVGTWLQAVTVGVLVAKITGQATATGVIGVAAFATQGIGSPIGGVFADRVDRRKMLMATLSVQIFFTTILAIVLRAPRPNVTVLGLLIACQGLAGSVGGPAGQSLVPSLVPREELFKAISFQAMSWNLGRILGSSLAAVLGIWFAPMWLIVGNAISFVVLLVVLGSVKGEFRAARQETKQGFLRELNEGRRTLWSIPGCRFALLGMIFLQLTVVPWVGLIPIFAQKRLHGGRGLASAIVVMQGAGAIFGATLAAVMVASVGRPRAIALSGGISTVALIVYATARVPAVALVSSSVIGMGIVGMYVSLAGVMQRDAPEHARARIISIQSAALGGCYGLGVYVSGRFADRFGLTQVHVANAIMFGIGLLVAVTVLRKHWAVVGHGDPRSRRVERILENQGRNVRPQP